MANYLQIHTRTQRTAYLASGDPGAPLVVMLHGFPDNAHSWDELRPKVAEQGFYAVAPFLRGYAPTEIPGRDTTAKTLGEDVIALAEALDKKRCIVLGNDWGASAGYKAAELHPEFVSHLFTTAIPHPAAVRPTPAMLYAVRHFFAFKLPGAVARFAANDFAALKPIIQRWSPDWKISEQELESIKKTLRAEGSCNAALGYYRALKPGGYGPIEVPTVSFAGRDDPSVRPQHFEAARRFFRSEYEVVEVPGGHFMHREHPEAFASAFLSRLPAASAAG